MDKRILETIIIDQAEELELKKSHRFCTRKEEDEIDLESPQAQVVIGVRRSGKSTLCYNALMRKGIKFAYVNFDDERLVKLTADDLNDILEVLLKIYGDFRHLFIDEIQNIDGWHLFVNRLLRRGIHVIITGSNAKLLSSELSTYLTGRHHSITLYPFSFSEYCDAKSVDTASHSTKGIAEIRAAFDQYMLQGGFPELLFIKNHRSYITQLVSNILTNDIEHRFKIIHTAAFEQLSHHLLNIAPAIVADKSLKDTFDIKSTHTVKNYINYLCQAYLLIGLHKYSTKSAQRIVGTKIYPIDVALMNDRDDSFAAKNLGWRLEVIVYLELLRRYKPLDHDIYYMTDRTWECDFVICSGNNVVQCIQVSYDISAEKTRRRELDGLVMAARKTGCENLLLLTDHEYADIIHQGHAIAIRPTYAYALS